MNDIQKRSQIERMTIAESILEGIWEEIKEGKIEDNHGLLQMSCYAQIYANRINWLLNKKLSEEVKE